MPINKFGSHFLDKPISDTPLSSVLSSPFYLWDPSAYHSKCFIRIKGIKKLKLNKDLYILDNLGTAFVFNFSGKIESIRHYSADGIILINSKPYKYNSLAGTFIEKGDKIEFKLGTPDEMCADFVFQCLLEKNV